MKNVETGPKIVTKETQMEWLDRDIVQFMIPEPKFELTDEDMEHLTGYEPEDVTIHYEKADEGLWDILQIQLLNVMAVRKLTSVMIAEVKGGAMIVTLKFGERWSKEEGGV
jgi:hypothetical protein